MNYYSTLISAAQLQALITQTASGQSLCLFDCSFDLMDSEAGERAFRAAHLPGAVYARLDTHLSAPHGARLAPNNADRAADVADVAADNAASGGRHPLPQRDTFAAWLARIGLTPNMQAVVYDRNGANYCGRLWWMLKWVGHENVAVLDGGLQAWQAAGGALSSGDSARPFAAPSAAKAVAAFPIRPPLATLVDGPTVLRHLGSPTQTVLDARAAPRFRGEVEPLDPVAGHIPGALNRPFSLNLGPDGKFKPAAQLKAEFEALLQGRDAASVVHQCGSGVSALPNLLAMEIAGLGRTALYAGSWSDWCSDPTRPVEKG